MWIFTQILLLQVTVCGSRGTFYGVFEAKSLQCIEVLWLQEPLSFRVLSEVVHVNPSTLQHLVEFYEGKFKCIHLICWLLLRVGVNNALIFYWPVPNIHFE